MKVSDLVFLLEGNIKTVALPLFTSALAFRKAIIFYLKTAPSEPLPRFPERASQDKFGEANSSSVEYIGQKNHGPILITLPDNGR